MKLLSLSLLTVAVAMVGCNQEKPQRPPQSPKSVSYISINEEPVKIQTELKGRLTAMSEAEVRPQITGIIQSIIAKEGTSVKKGDILYKVDPAQYQASYNQAVAAYESVLADISTAKLKAQRYQALVANKAISSQDADDAQSNYKKLVSTLAERKSAVDSAKINLGYTDIKAPIQGILGISTVTPGALVTANQINSINTITSLNPIYLDITQSSKEFMQMMNINKDLSSPSIVVDLKLDNNSPIIATGHVSSNELKVDSSTDSLKVRAIFENKEKSLLPGMFAYATITYGIQEKGIQIPLQSIIRETNGSSSVYTIDSNNKVKVAPIEILYNNDNKAIISKGLKQGDKIIFEGIDKVKNGDEVNPVEKE